MLTEDEAAVVVEVARLFVDPVTGQVPTVTVRLWGGELKEWWQKRCPTEGRITPSEARVNDPEGGNS